MRAQYMRDRDEAVGTHYVATMYFSQNLTLPNDPQTPSAWYFLSLISVSVFGVFLANDNRQRNFVYSERKGGKGSNEVISMVHHFLREENIIPSEAPGLNTFTLYADNCTGQNKNKAVMMYFRWLVNAGYLEEANVKFFVKGHTKNSCDRAFGQIKRKYNRNECWTVAQAGGLVQDSAASNICVMLEDNAHPFQDFKRALSVLYKDLPLIKKFQLFRMPKTAPGVIECRVQPQGRIETFNIRRKSKVPAANSAALDLLATIKPLPPPPEHPEKIHDIHQKILPFVPEEYQSDPIYREPTAADWKKPQKIKKARRKPQPDAAASKKQSKGKCKAAESKKNPKRKRPPSDEDKEAVV
ncbi:hypothetical protein PF008_g19165 [Phytophthora fragariae]|uniref:DUF7869 domain-containing protein n=2 Tax=Phytophthora fragariae TaxID=53985 RepID=A0A6G0R3C6_9STRA|nr:hypothetical protein PF008_g19165 [Phytophthora fragariae]